MIKTADLIYQNEVIPVLAEYGHLTLLKEAEEVTEDTYDNETSKLKRMLGKSMEKMKEYKGKVSGGIGKSMEKLKEHKGKVLGGASGLGVLAAGYGGYRNRDKLSNLLDTVRNFNIDKPVRKFVGKRILHTNPDSQRLIKFLMKMYENPKTTAGVGAGLGAVGLAALGYGGVKGGKALYNKFRTNKQEEAAE
jgi:hypothetical protein